MRNTIETAVAREDRESTIILAADESCYLLRGLRALALDHGVAYPERTEDLARRSREVAERLVELASLPGIGDRADGDLNRAVALLAGAGVAAVFGSTPPGGVDPRSTVPGDFVMEDAAEYDASARLLIESAAELLGDVREVTERWLDGAGGDARARGAGGRGGVGSGATGDERQQPGNRA